MRKGSKKGSPNLTDGINYSSWCDSRFSSVTLKFVKHCPLMESFCAGQIPCHCDYWYCCNTLAACHWSGWPTLIVDCRPTLMLWWVWANGIPEFPTDPYEKIPRRIDFMTQNWPPGTATVLALPDCKLVSSGNTPPLMSMPLGKDAILSSGHGPGSEATTNTEQSRVPGLIVRRLLRLFVLHHMSLYTFIRCKRLFHCCENTWLTVWLWSIRTHSLLLKYYYIYIYVYIYI